MLVGTANCVQLCLVQAGSDTSFTNSPTLLPHSLLRFKGVTSGCRWQESATMDKIKYHAVIKFLMKEGKKVKEIHDRLVAVYYNDTAPSHASYSLTQGILSWL